jgi:hypothetical protein
LVASSMRLFGTGVLQARLPIMILAVICIFLLFEFAYSFYGRRSAWTTIFILLFLVPNPLFHPLIYGRQAIGEVPMLFYLLMGYWFWVRGLRGSKFGIILTCFFWGLAILTKRQTLPFWLFALVITSLLAYFNRNRNVFYTNIISVVGTVIFFICFKQIENYFVGNLPQNGPPLQRLYSLAAWTLNPQIRLALLSNLPSFCLSGIFGLGYAIPRIRTLVRNSEINVVNWLEISLFFLATSWFFWFTFGSLGWWRYYQPIFLLSAPFFGKYITDALSDFRINKYEQTKSLNQMKWKGFLNPKIGIIILLFIQIFYFQTSSYLHMFSNNASHVKDIADYINEQTEISALIETYEGELFFFLQRRYHYPPDQLQIDLNRKRNLQEDIQIHYNPLEANPDYLVVGPAGKDWGLYEPSIQSGDFRLIKEFSDYTIYKRVIRIYH